MVHITRASLRNTRIQKFLDATHRKEIVRSFTQIILIDFFSELNTYTIQVDN